MVNNTIGTLNTATGYTATGADALQNNTTGSDNTASGYDALLANTTGAATQPPAETR